MSKLAMLLLTWVLYIFVHINEANPAKQMPRNLSDRKKRSADDNNCVYTFYVAPTDANTCPFGSNVDQSNQIKELKNSITLQHGALTQKLEELGKVIQELKKDRNDAGNDAGNDNSSKQPVGTHYTRWGSVSCPSTAKLLYKGFAGKSYYTHGGGVNYLCMPEDPVFPDNASSGFESLSYIYGVEYERHNSPLVPQEKHDKDVPCAVCHVTGRGEQLMIPAKKSCPPKWTREYDGILMAQHHLHKGSDFICVDKAMDVLQGGSGNSNGGLLYTVESKCGSLKCPPYENGKEILCVVCTL